MMYLGENPVGLVIERGSYGTSITLPQEYERLAYLESTGTQCIDTGINLKLSSEVEIDGYHLNSSESPTQYPRLLGTSNPSLFISCTQRGNYTNHVLKSANFYYMFGNGTERTISFLPALRMRHKINKNFYSITIDGEIFTDIYNATSVSENSSSTITLFCSNDRGNYVNFTPCRIYEYKYSENNVVLRHMFPAKRKSDDELGMYDVINDVFYTNAGTGTFIAGIIA